MRQGLGKWHGWTTNGVALCASLLLMVGAAHSCEAFTPSSGAALNLGGVCRGRRCAQAPQRRGASIHGRIHGVRGIELHGDKTQKVRKLQVDPIAAIFRMQDDMPQTAKEISDAIMAAYTGVAMPGLASLPPARVGVSGIEDGSSLKLMLSSLLHSDEPRKRMSPARKQLFSAISHRCEPRRVE